MVNRVRRRILQRMDATIDDAMDKAGLPLLGVVPEDDALALALHNGKPLLLSNHRSRAAVAYQNMAIRLQGGRAPLQRI